TNCFDTLMGSITINNVPSNCNAEFYLFQDSTNVNMYYAWDLSTGNNLDYHWDFGDGNSSNQQYPTHTYTSPGIYSLCLTITDAAGGCTDIYCDSVEALTKASGTTINILPEGETASLNNTETLENEVSLYPNPASSTINLKVESSKSSQVEYKVLDVTGKIVINNSMTISSGINDEKINVDHIRQGVYFIQITSLTTGERLDTLKFVKK
ncbi:MAG: PKD domain-containing protein, partial [Brumimicrobium sp.]